MSSLQYCLLQVLVLHAGISTPCVIVLQVELQYIHFGEHLTLSASQITMAIVHSTFYCVHACKTAVVYRQTDSQTDKHFKQVENSDSDLTATCPYP